MGLRISQTCLQWTVIPIGRDKALLNSPGSGSQPSAGFISRNEAVIDKQSVSYGNYSEESLRNCFSYCGASN